MFIECHLTDVAKSCPWNLMFFSTFFHCFKILQNPLWRNLRFRAFSELSAPFTGAFLWASAIEIATFFLRNIPGRPLRLFRSEENCWFLLAVFVLKSYYFSAVRPSRGCNNGLVVLQRQPRCNAAGALLQPREGLTASPPPLRGFPMKISLFVCDYEWACYEICKYCLPKNLGFWCAHSCDICARGGIKMKSPCSRGA